MQPVTRKPRSPQPTVLVRADEICTVGGIGQRMGLDTGKRVGEWIARHDSFPLPLAVLKLGRVYSWLQADRWMQTTTFPIDIGTRPAVAANCPDPDREVLSTDLAGAHEVAGHFGVQVQTVRLWSEAYSDFPLPVVSVGRLQWRIFSLPDIKIWHARHADPVTGKLVGDSHPTRFDLDPCPRCGIDLGAHRDLNGDGSVGTRRTCVKLLRMQAGKAATMERVDTRLERWSCTVEIEIIFPSDEGEVQDKAKAVIDGVRRVHKRGSLAPGIHRKGWVVGDVDMKQVQKYEGDQWTSTS